MLGCTDFAGVLQVYINPLGVVFDFTLLIVHFHMFLPRSLSSTAFHLISQRFSWDIMIFSPFLSMSGLIFSHRQRGGCSGPLFSYSA